MVTFFLFYNYHCEKWMKLIKGYEVGQKQQEEFLISLLKLVEKRWGKALIKIHNAF